MPVTVSAPTVTLGIDRLLSADRRLIEGRRVGVVCNPASINGEFRHSADLIFEHPGTTLAAIFGPQHGFRADLQDNMIETPHSSDERRRVPVYSLYSEVREPSCQMLQGIDVFVVDLQDVGTRVYTFIYTMANTMRAAARARLPVIVCDRPNPVNGVDVAGHLIDQAYSSFVGQFPIPLRHGLTIGELARLFNTEFGINADLHVIPMDGWTRGMFYDQTALPWVMPSPNIPTLDSAIVYPGAVLFEGTMFSEGRGTTRPFELIGAPWIDGDRYAEAMNARDLPGVTFRPVFFEPTFQKHAKKTCGGCQPHVTDRQAFKPVRTAIEMLEEFRQQDPSNFAWRQPPYEYEHDKMPIDILYGSAKLRTAIEGDTAGALIESAEQEEERFHATRRPFLLY
ncbi:DUF1343 domain-containing protein [soil metagenome]